MSALIFGQSVARPPKGYGLNLVRQILKEKPELAKKPMELLKEVDRRKQYEVRMDSVLRYARKFNS